MSESIYSIAVLLACYNRREKTLGFLESLAQQNIFGKHAIDIYLLDDASSDGTAEAVKAKYPQVTIVAGTGNLFWAGGMRKVWTYAISQKDYDLFCLFNDDVVLFDDALQRILYHYSLAGSGNILVGSTRDPATNAHSYGGFIQILHPIKFNRFILTEPDETKLVPCNFAHANILLADKATVKKIGIFSSRYTHFFADFDYTYTAYKSGIAVLIAPGYYGYCEDDHGNKWLSQGKPLKQRIAYLYNPKGLAYKEHLYYIKKHYPHRYLSEAVKLWMQTLFPIIWDKYKNPD